MGFLKALLDRIWELRTEQSFAAFTTQLAGIAPEAAREAFKHPYFSEMIDVRAITEAAQLGPRFGFTHADVSFKAGSLIEFAPLVAATGMGRRQLSGTPSEAQRLVRR